MPVNRTFDLTGGQRIVGEDPALLQPKLKRSWNPFHYLWIGWEHFAYLFAPNNNCVYCWTFRMFLLGMLVGGYLVHVFPWIRLW